MLPLVFFASFALASPEEEGAIPRLTLDGAIEAAMQNAQEVVRAKEDLLLADVDKMRALATILPTVNFSAAVNQYSYGDFYTEARTNYSGPFVDYHSTYSHPSFNAVLSGRQLIYDGGRWWTLLSRSKDVMLFRQSALGLAQASLRLLVVRRFYDLAKSTRGVETFTVQVQYAEAQLKRALEQLQTGRGGQNDVAAAERNLASDNVTLARRLAAESTRARLLNLSMGREPDVLYRLVVPKEVETTTTTLRPMTIPRTEVLLVEAVKLRPEVAASEANLEILRKNVEIRAADYFPTVGLNATYSRASRRPDRVYGDPTWNYFALFGLDIRWNLFAGGATDASVQEGEVELRKAHALHQDLLRNIRSDVLERVNNLRLLAQVFELFRAGARAAEEAAKLVSIAYRENRATLLELRDAEFRLITARDQIYEARFDLEVALEELRRAVGAEVLDRADVPVQEIK
jgi:OMF family outer membrane factor